MLDHATQRSWWKSVLTGFLAFAFGASAVMIPGESCSWLKPGAQTELT